MIVSQVNGIDLGGYLERDARPLGDRNGAIRPLLGRDPPKKREVAATGLRRKSVEALGQAVMHGTDPIGEGQRLALAVGNGYEGIFGPPLIGARQILDVQTAVQGGDGTRRHIREERKMQQIDMEMQDVERIR